MDEPSMGTCAHCKVYGATHRLPNTDLWFHLPECLNAFDREVVRRYKEVSKAGRYALELREASDGI